MLNSLVASDNNLKSDNLLVFNKKAVSEDRINILPNPKEVWMDTVLFIDNLGYKMGYPLEDTIDLYSRALTGLFVKTGNILAKIPQLLTGSPPYAKAMGY